ncbi:aldo/keto reductase [Compostimonas suwonensis]|uniref:D-threo-aldose 1-dehydrogenase n=1 Tax=Compostimonas suwonensis TaxID=1048394 RepID=A0A2M9C4B3_9MICO|nr:aldo/keto reductase [Compostimonas suwonensis]PJJ65375.1 D-threo-aldose 1-dehydrogenase [Compostimonas suwonensis]
MRTRVLTNGLELTELGVGMAQFGNLYRATTDEDSVAAVDAAWAGGIRYFDTAPHYGLGLSERRAGLALSSRPRDEFVLSTKVGRLIVDNPGGEGGRDTEGFDVPADKRRQWDFSRDGILRSIEESLTRLGLDRIDIAYLHDPDDFRDQATDEALPALVELRDQGVLRAIGAGMNQAELPAHFIRNSDVDVIMLAGRYTLLEQGALDDLLPLAVERGVGIVAAGVYNSGLLSANRVPADAHYNYEPAPAELIDRANRIAEVCERHGVTLPEAAVAFPLLHPAVVSVVLGARTAAQVESNFDRFDTPVPAQLWRDLHSEGLLPQGAFTSYLEN